MALLLIASALSTRPSRADSPSVDIMVRQSALPSAANSWQYLAAEVRNKTNSPVEPTIVAALDDNPRTQFATQTWVPPNASRLVNFLARTGTSPRDARSTSILMGLYDGADSQRLLAQKELPLRRNIRKRFIVEFTDAEDLATPAMIDAARKHAASDADFAFINLAQLPPSYFSMSHVTHMVLATDATRLQLNQINALRDWLLRGGKLLIIEPRVRTSLLETLVGSDFNLARIDQIPQAQISTSTPRNPAVTFDPPVVLSRMVYGPPFESLVDCANWPLALRASVGEGEIFVLTLDSPAWLQLANNMPPSTPFEIWSTAFFSDPAREISFAAAAPSAAPAPSPQWPSDHAIGFEIPSRITIALALALFVIALAVVGVICVKRGSVVSLVASSVVIALLVSAVLISVGNSVRGKVPPTVSSVARATVYPDLSRTFTVGQSSVYTHDPSGATLSSQAKSLVWPDGQPQIGQTWRCTWSADGTPTWQNLSLPAGAVMHAHFSATSSASAISAVRGRFTEKGLACTITGEEAPSIRGVLLRTPAGFLYEPGTAGPTFLVQNPTVSSLKEIRRRVDASTSDERHILAPLLAANPMEAATPRPYAYVLSRKIAPAPLSLEQLSPAKPTRQIDAISYQVPLQFEPNVPGDRVTIPDAFVTLITRGPQKSDRRSALFDPTRNEWLPSVNYSVEFTIGFALPRAVLPLAIDRLDLSLLARIPGRTCRIAPRARPQNAVTVTKEEGLSTLALDPAFFTADENGVVWLDVSVSDLNAPVPLDNPRSTWEFSRIALAVQGTVSQPATKK